MKRIIVRNVKHKDVYRQEIVGDIKGEQNTGIQLSEDAYIPYALIEKAIYQILASGDRTFISNVKQTFTSSYAAVLDSSIIERSIPAINMLSELNLNNAHHPKMKSVCDEIIAKQKRGIKVLVFCNRLETMKALRENLTAELDKSYKKDIINLFPESGQKGFNNYCKRFYTKQDISWLLLQENYIYSVLPAVMKACGSNFKIPRVEAIKDKAISIYASVNKSAKTDYSYVKRITEHLVFTKLLSRFDIDRSLEDNSALLHITKKILDVDYINSSAHDFELVISEGDKQADRDISEAVKRVLSYKGIWSLFADSLNQIEPLEREELVTNMIEFLRRDKRFFVELRKKQIANPKVRDYSRLVSETFRKKGILEWENAYKRYLAEYIENLNQDATREFMRLGLSPWTRPVEVIDGSDKDDAKKRIRAGFNTPFYPQILLATQVMQEGLDLQKECKDVIHYDLEWNPASLEQRVGRVDRIGSLISKIRDQGYDEKLYVYYPFIKNTIDESIYITVKEREKWFNLILGGTPQWDTFDVDPDIINLDPAVLKRLQINLSVSS